MYTTHIIIQETIENPLNKNGGDDAQFLPCNSTVMFITRFSNHLIYYNMSVIRDDRDDRGGARRTRVAALDARPHSYARAIRIEVYYIYLFGQYRYMYVIPYYIYIIRLFSY